jgi:hypothetical protein
MGPFLHFSSPCIPDFPLFPITETALSRGKNLILGRDPESWFPAAVAIRISSDPHVPAPAVSGKYGIGDTSTKHSLNDSST